MLDALGEITLAPKHSLQQIMIFEQSANTGMSASSGAMWDMVDFSRLLGSLLPLDCFTRSGCGDRLRPLRGERRRRHPLLNDFLARLRQQFGDVPIAIRVVN